MYKPEFAFIFLKMLLTSLYETKIMHQTAENQNLIIQYFQAQDIKICDKALERLEL